MMTARSRGSSAASAREKRSTDSRRSRIWLGRSALGSSHDPLPVIGFSRDIRRRPLLQCRAI
jgi:hypothetical protein